MVMKEYQERLVALVKDTLTLLCKNGLEYSQEFAVEGLLGITLDKNEVFLIPIHEMVKDKVKEVEEPEPVSEDIPESRPDRSPKRERKKKRRHLDSNQHGDASFDVDPVDYDQDQPDRTQDADPENDQQTPAKRPRDIQPDLSNVKAEDIVVIKEEDDDDYEGFQDNSLDNSAFNQTDQSGDGMPFFAQPGTSQGGGDMNFSLEQISGTGIPGAMGAMPPEGMEGDMSEWLQQQAENGQQGDWQGGQGQKQQWPCDLCRRIFPHRSWLKRHKDGVHLKVRHSCQLCARTYSQKGDLLRHMLMIHPTQSPEPGASDDFNSNG